MIPDTSTQMKACVVRYHWVSLLKTKNFKTSVVCSMSRTLIGCIRFLKDPSNALEFMD